MMIMQHMNDLYLRRCDQQQVVIHTVQEELLRKFYESPMYDFLLEGMDRREGRMTLRRGCFQKLLRTVGVLARSLSAHKRPRHITPTDGLREEVKHVVIFNSSSLDHSIIRGDASLDIDLKVEQMCTLSDDNHSNGGVASSFHELMHKQSILQFLVPSERRSVDGSLQPPQLFSFAFEDIRNNHTMYYGASLVKYRALTQMEGMDSDDHRDLMTCLLYTSDAADE